MKYTVRDYVLTLLIMVFSLAVITIFSGCATLSPRASTTLILEAYELGRQDGIQEVKDFLKKLAETMPGADEYIPEPPDPDGINKNPKLKM
jgi:hypothetical protein